MPGFLAPAGSGSTARAWMAPARRAAGLGDTRRRGGTHARAAQRPGATPGRWGHQLSAVLRGTRDPNPRAHRARAEALRGPPGTGDRGPGRGEAAGRPTPRPPRTGSRVSAGGAAPPRSRPRRLRLFPSAAARPPARDPNTGACSAAARDPGAARPRPAGRAMMLLLVGTCLVAFVLLLYMLSPLISPKPLALPGAHVVVTGGSSGIGKCIAIECYKQGAFITLVARNEERLLQAKKEIEKHSINDKQVVLCISVDVSQDYSQVENVIKQAQEKLGPVDMLINCAGMSVSGKFEDLEVSTFEKLMSINYLGSVYPSRAVITTMKERRVGRIVFLSSQAGQVGLYGFTAYSSSKFAIKGLAEALQMENRLLVLATFEKSGQYSFCMSAWHPMQAGEVDVKVCLFIEGTTVVSEMQVKPYNVYVTVAYPPDTDTPGFAEENKTKPLETRLISETTSICTPEQVAKQIVKDAIQGNFNSSVGSDGYMLSSLTCGMSPVTSITEGLQQVVTMGLFRMISLFYLGSFDNIIRRCMIERTKYGTADKTA
ncbi:hypothetical protein QTO34_002136 [Cnephaeus nilssonii]|uniref:3-dehydrosphinganine reductase n=1 Tax=Cnephaeus nilssonii TaxID=3371016 RepID=A0AA40HV23_CNENI|nr:hypothetical protein QTO34_002136 [Eptesicus nilssonii]